MATPTLHDVEDVAPLQAPPRAVLSRRSALKMLGMGGATVLVAASGVISYRVFDNGVLDSGSGRPYEPWSTWRQDPSPVGAVGAAILAANPHNTQPWLFHVTSSSVDVFADSGRGMPAVDPFDREHNVGMGCALENLVLALNARDYRPTATLLPDVGDQTHIATVTLTSGTAIRTALYEAIGDRHSNRGPYRAQAVPTTVLDDLEAQATGLGGVGVRWFTSTKGNPYLKAALGEAAASAARTNTFLGARYRRLVNRIGKLTALVAIARSILATVWELLTDPTGRYADLGPKFINQPLRPEHRKQNHIRQLEAPGHKVTLEPPAA